MMRRLSTENIVCPTSVILNLISIYLNPYMDKKEGKITFLTEKRKRREGYLVEKYT